MASYPCPVCRTRIVVPDDEVGDHGCHRCGWDPDQGSVKHCERCDEEFYSAGGTTMCEFCREEWIDEQNAEYDTMGRRLD